MTKRQNIYALNGSSIICCSKPTDDDGRNLDIITGIGGSDPVIAAAAFMPLVLMAFIPLNPVTVLTAALVARQVKVCVLPQSNETVPPGVSVTVPMYIDIPQSNYYHIIIVIVYID